MVVGAVAVRAADIQLVDSIQAVVNDAPITAQAVERVVGPEEEYVYQRYSTQPELYRKEVLALKESGTDALIDREVILREFKENLKVPESIIDEFVNDRLKEKYPDNIALTKQLQSEGITLEQLKKEIRDTFIIEQMRIKNVPEPIISPRKVETYYAEHHDDFKLEDQIKMRLIFLQKADDVATTRKRAEEILSQINGGASFEEMARAYSEGPARADGGETGWEDLSIVTKTLATEIVKLKPGQHSDVVEVPEGFYLILLEDRHPEHIKPLTEVRPQIEQVLSGQERARLSKQWIERLRNRTFVRIF